MPTHGEHVKNYIKLVIAVNTIKYIQHMPHRKTVHPLAKQIR